MKFFKLKYSEKLYIFWTLLIDTSTNVKYLSKILYSASLDQLIDLGFKVRAL